MHNDHFWNILIVLPDDYRDYGGTVERWKHPEENYPDCSTCPYFFKISKDGWGICTKTNTPRAGLLTYENQSGYRCHGH